MYYTDFCNFTYGFREIRIQNSGGVTYHKSIIPSSNQVTIKTCIWQNYYIMIILLPNTVKSTRQIFKLEKKLNCFCLEKNSCVIFWVKMYRVWHKCHVLKPVDLQHARTINAPRNIGNISHTCERQFNISDKYRGFRQASAVLSSRCQSYSQIRVQFCQK